MEINSFRWEFKKTPGIRLLLSNFEIAGFLRQCILDTFLSSTWQNKTNFSDHLLSVRPSVRPYLFLELLGLFQTNLALCNARWGGFKKWIRPT